MFLKSRDSLGFFTGFQQIKFEIAQQVKLSIYLGISLKYKKTLRIYHKIHFLFIVIYAEL